MCFSLFKIPSSGSHCVFLGYQSGIKGYKLYDLENKHMFFSRDVFPKDVFSFHSISCSDSLNDHFPELVLPRPPPTFVSNFSVSPSFPPTSKYSPDSPVHPIYMNITVICSPMSLVRSLLPILPCIPYPSPSLMRIFHLNTKYLH